MPGYAELGAVLGNGWTPYNASFVDVIYNRFDDLEEKRSANAAHRREFAGRG